MEKINFTNGQAPVINGTNLNQLQTNIEDAFSRQMIQAKVTSGSLVIGTASIKVSFDEIKKIGDKLSYDSTKKVIKIGKDISKVILSCWFNYAPYQDDQTPIKRIYKNNEEVYAFGISCPKAWSNSNFSYSGLIIDVVEGDEISYQLTGNVASVQVRPNSYVTIEGIN